MLEIQPSIHFSLISQFFIHTETIQFFRCSKRLYSIPLQIPIFLHYFNDSNHEKNNFNFSDFLSSKFLKNLSSNFSTVPELNFNLNFNSNINLNSKFNSNSNINSEFIPYFRFYIISLRISTKFELNQWKKLFSSNSREFYLFSHLIHLELGNQFFSLSLPLIKEFLPFTVKSLKIIRFKNPIDFPELFILPQLKSIELENFTGSLPLSFNSINSLNTVNSINSLNSLNSLNSINSLNSSLESLTLSNSIEENIYLNFPISLISLNLSNFIYISSIEFPLLNELINLIELELPKNFNQSLNKYLFPLSLKFLQFGEQFNQPIYSEILPLKLKELKFSEFSHFNQPVQIDWIPIGIQILTIQYNFQFPQFSEIFPSSLKILNIH